jgi:hypothetical protein
MCGFNGKWDELFSHMMVHGIDLAFICETWAGQFSKPPNECILGHSPWPHGPKGRTGHNPYGVAFVLHPRWLPFKDRFSVLDTPDAGISAKIRFDSLVVAGVYLPPLSTQQECLNILQGLLPEGGSGTGNRTLLLGDFNMRLSSATGDRRTNQRGQQLYPWLLNQGWIHCPTPRGHPTCVTGANAWSIVDYVFASLDLEAQILDAQVADEVSIGGSDHHLVVCRVLQVPSTKEKEKEKNKKDRTSNAPQLRIRLKRLEDDQHLAEYQRELQERLRQHQMADRKELDLQAWMDELDQRITGCTLDAARYALGVYTPRATVVRFATPELNRARATRRSCFQAWRLAPPSSTDVRQQRWIEYREARCQEKRLVHDAARRIFDDFADAIANKTYTERIKILASMAKKRRSSSSSSPGSLVGLKSDTQSMEEYRVHFESIFNSSTRALPLEEGDLDVDVDEEDLLAGSRSSSSSPPQSSDLLPFAKSDVENALRSIRPGKAAGRTGLRGELLRAGADVLAPWVFELFQAVWTFGLCPSSWKMAAIFPLHKKGAKDAIGNYRPISLTEALRKVFEQCILPAVQSIVEPLDIRQGGFRRARGTLEQVACVHDAIVSRTKTLGGSPHLAFLDIKNAYDSVMRPKLWKVMHHRGASGVLLGVLRALFDGNRSRLVVAGDESGSIRHASGLLQGSILSPILYSLFVDELPRRLETLGRPGMSEVSISSFLYADDIALIADSAAHMQDMLDVCQQHAAEYGYAFAPGKCAYIPGGAPPRRGRGPGRKRKLEQTLQGSQQCDREEEEEETTAAVEDGEQDRLLPRDRVEEEVTQEQHSADVVDAMSVQQWHEEVLRTRRRRRHQRSATSTSTSTTSWVNPQPSPVAAATDVFLHGVKIPRTTEFCYLGMVIGPRGLIPELCAEERVRKVTQALHMFRSFGFNARGMRLETRRTMFKVFLRPVMEYGLALIKSKGALFKLQSAQSMALRFMFSAPQNTSTTALHALAAVPLVSARHVVLRAKWLQRVQHAQPDNLIHHALKSFREQPRFRSILHHRRRRVETAMLDNVMDVTRPGIGDDDNDVTLTQQQVNRFMKQHLQELRTPSKEEAIALPLTSTLEEGGIPILDGFVDKGASQRVALWMLRRPFGRPEVCLRCKVHRATTRHVQTCSTINVDALLRKGQLEIAAEAIKMVAQQCTQWTFSWDASWRGKPEVSARHLKASLRPP